MESAESRAAKRAMVRAMVLILASLVLLMFGFAFGFIVNGKFAIGSTTSYAIFTEFVATMLLVKVLLKMRMPWLAVANIAVMFIVLGFEFFN